MHKLISKIKSELETAEDKVARTNKMNCQELQYVKSLAETWLNLKEIKENYYEDEDDGTVEKGMPKDYIYGWAAKLMNSDGTKGAYWTMAETSDVARNNGIFFDTITEQEWYMTMNMIYSDYSGIAKKYGVDSISFYVDLAKQWLWDADTKQGSEKLKCYYKNIVKH